MRFFFRNSTQGGEVGAFNRYHQKKSSIKFNFIEEELCFNGRIFDIIEEKYKLQKVIKI